MEFRVLGGLEVLDGQTRIRLKGRQQQLVLALLLANSGTAVSTDTLIDEIWGDQPPDTARKAIQSYVAQLRSAINTNGEVLASRDGGYVLNVAPDNVDAAVFERETAAGRSELLSDPSAAAKRLDHALKLWRGVAYDSLVETSPKLQAEGARLEELKLAAIETRLRAGLAIEDPAMLIGELERLIAEHPTRERFRALLIVALYRAGRQSDALAAYQNARLVLAEEIGIEPSAELQRLEQRILAQDPTLEGADPLSLDTDASVAELRNPYKGLRAFEESDAADFFGRRDLIDRVTERLRRRDNSARFIALTGPSGSGKSSVVRAGIVPVLRSGAIATLEHLPVITIYPGQDPVSALETALAAESITGPLAEHSVVLVVDQFEEVFTLADPDGRDAFLETVVDAATRPGGRARVIITIRGDFLDHALMHPGLAQLFGEGLELVPPLDEQELKAAITEPARRVGLLVETELVAEMVRDVASRPAALPLLQYVLTDLFERTSGDTLTLADYRLSGGIVGALSRRAEDLYNSMDETDKEATQQVYLRLVAIGDEAQHVRRRVTRSELAGLPLPPESVERVISRYGDQRLLAFDRDPTSGEATVEVPHESLLREWPRLREWIEASRGALISRRRLVTAAAEWVAADNDPSYAARGLLLEEFERLASGSTVSLTETELDFVRAGRAAAEGELRARSRRRRLLVAVLAGATVVSLALAGFAFYQRGQADEQARSATARELAAAAVTNLDTDPERSILLALRAIDTTRSADGTVLREAEEALHQAVQTSRLVYTLDTGSGLEFSPDGELLATTTDHGAVSLWDATTGQFVRELIGPVGVGPWPMMDLAFSGDGSLVSANNAFRADNRGRLTPTWNVATGEQVSLATGSGSESGSPALNLDGSLLAMSSLDSTVTLFDTVTGTEVGAFGHGDRVLQLSFSPDGSRLAVAAGDIIHVWDVPTQTRLYELIGHEAAVSSVAFLPNGDHLISGSFDGTARIWDLDEQTTTLRLPTSSPVRAVAAAGNGRTVATGGEDGVVRLWDLISGRQTLTLSGHTTPVFSLSFNHDDTLLASGPGLDAFINATVDRLQVEAASSLRENTGSTVTDVTRVWSVGADPGRQPMAVPALTATSDTTTPNQIASLDLVRRSGRVGDIEISPDGSQLAVTDADGEVSLWDLGSGQKAATLSGHLLRVTGIAYSPSGETLATAAPDGVKTWTVATGSLLRSVLENDPPLRFRSVWYIDVEFSPNGDRLAVSREDQTLMILDATTGEEIARHRPDIVDIEFSPDGETIAGGSKRQAAVMVELAGGSTAFLHADTVVGVAFSPDGSRLATVSRDGKATVWDLASDSITGTSIFSIDAERLAFRAIAYNPDGESFATAGEDGTVRIWNADDGSPQLTLHAHDGPVVELSYGPDGNRLASISVDGTARLHILDIDAMIDLARSRLTRSFTDAECRQYLHQDECEAG